MRYFRTTDERIHGHGANWDGDPTYWIEVNESGDAERELQLYPNGMVLCYDRMHDQDDYGALSIMVIDGNESWWSRFEISSTEFEEMWRTHLRFCDPGERGG